MAWSIILRPNSNHLSQSLARLSEVRNNLYLMNFIGRLVSANLQFFIAGTL